MKRTWLGDDDWAWLQRTIPIAHVDVLPVRYGRARSAGVSDVGLIRRLCPTRGAGWGLRWSLLGGRIQYGDSIRASVGRQLRETLGRGVAVRGTIPWEPTTVSQYFPRPRRDFLRDPRKHAVSFVYAVELRGTPRPQGEARAFRWFPVGRLPPHSAMGFENWKVVDRCLANLARD
ncbi:MAG TPA: DUF4916 domain-containing protein [Thermoplasmata archaeon]|nr:DUF4916 domain-containing protein [Thermoplasmata archaeon]